jgi:MraZ protein
VAQTAPGADLMPPVSLLPALQATAEPPTFETTSASAKPPEREDNTYSGPARLAAPPRALAESSFALCLWSAVGGKVNQRTRRSVAHAEEPFVGTYLCTLDEQKCLVLPQKASEQMGLPRQVYVTPGPEGCLWISGAAGLERLTAKLGSDARRLYYAQTTRAAVDCAGRIVLPETAGCFRRDVVLLGVGDHFELWDAERLERYVNRKAAKK